MTFQVPISRMDGWVPGEALELQRESPGNEPGPPYSTKRKGGERCDDHSLHQDRSQLLWDDCGDPPCPKGPVGKPQGPFRSIAGPVDTIHRLRTHKSLRLSRTPYSNSVPLKKNGISTAAVSGASDPCA